MMIVFFLVEDFLIGVFTLGWSQLEQSRGVLEEVALGTFTINSQTKLGSN